MVDAGEGLDLVSKLLLYPLAPAPGVEKYLHDDGAREELAVAREIDDADAAASELSLDHVPVFENRSAVRVLGQAGEARVHTFRDGSTNGGWVPRGESGV